MLIHNYLWGLLAILKGDILIHSWLNGLLWKLYAILMGTCLKKVLMELLTRAIILR